MTTPNDVVNLFPHSTIRATHPPGQAPTYETIHSALSQLNANAASIPSNGGDGTLGHLVLTLGQATYQTLSIGHVDHPPPIAPAPLVIPQGTTAAMIAELRRDHDESKTTFKLYHTVDAALKKQILEATEETYLISLKDHNTGFARVTTRTIIEHLYTNYGRIDADALTKNENRMKAKWDVTTPIEPLFAQIDEGQAYATAGGEPYSDPQLVRIGYHTIEATKRMELACRDWRAKPVADKTWINLKIHMKAAHLDLGLTTTTDTGGYGANNAEEHAAEEATQAYLANMIDQQSATNTNMNALMETIKKMAEKIDILEKKKPVTGYKKNAKTMTPEEILAARQARLEHNNKEKHYCWTHGCRVVKEHTSANCKTPADGHKMAATYDNRMGGSTVDCTSK